jgi:hypothetical protein
MKIIAYLLAALLFVLGLVFIAGSQGLVMRLVVGGVLMAAAVAFLWLALQKPRPIETTVVQKIDLTGDVSLEQMKCRSCGGALSKDSISVKAGAIYVKCPFCEASYQIEEAPKW